MSILIVLKIWLLSVAILSFVRLRWALALMLAYLILVPIFKLGIPGLGMGQNVIFLSLLLGYFICMQKRKDMPKTHQNMLRKHKNMLRKHKYMLKKVKTDWYVLSPFVTYFVVSLLIIPFQTGEPLLVNLDYWRQGVMNSMILPFIIWNVIRIDPNSLPLLRRTLIFCIFVAIGYGLFLTQMEGINPYTFFFISISDTITQDYESYYSAEGTGRLFGRISSVFIHPMMFALFQGLAFIYLYHIRNKENPILVWGMLGATSLMMLFCGVRSVIGGMVVAVAYYLFRLHDFKLTIRLALIGFIALSLIATVPDLNDYVMSMTNSESTEVKGSSLEMRMNQLVGAMDIVKNDPVFGMGFNWTSYYQSLRGDHPICLAFESLIYVIICNSGYFGFLLWGWMIIQYFSVNKKLIKKRRRLVLVNSLVVFYIAYSTITGEYGYMKLFLIFYVMMMGEVYADKWKETRFPHH